MFPPGVRLALSYGLATLRRSAFMAYAQLWLGWEFQPATDGDPSYHAIRLGSRIGIDIDP